MLCRSAKWHMRRFISCRSFSVTNRRSIGFESVEVPCRSDGSITVDIFRPKNVDPGLSAVIGLFLPRGPLTHTSSNGDHDPDAANIAALLPVLPYPIVRINYRSSREHPSPTAIHDTVTAYDWAIKHLTSPVIKARYIEDTVYPRVFVCGELLGGSLAAMLALTECRLREPRIVAAALSNPIVDWVSLDEPLSSTSTPRKRRSLSSTKSRSRKSSLSSNETPSDAVTTPTKQVSTSRSDFLFLRQSLFPNPQTYFDPFASPTLFFRTAGRAPPTLHSTLTSIPTFTDPEDTVPTSSQAIDPGDEMAQLALLEREAYMATSPTTTSPSTINSMTDADDESSSPVKMRKSAKRYPSSSHALCLPHFHLDLDARSGLRAQGMEFAELVGKSFTRSGRGDEGLSSADGGGVGGDGRVVEGETLVRYPGVVVTETSGLGVGSGMCLWDGSTEGLARVRRAGEWIAGMLERGG